jgi:hypothetical protein
MMVEFLKRPRSRILGIGLGIVLVICVRVQYDGKNVINDENLGAKEDGDKKEDQTWHDECECFRSVKGVHTVMNKSISTCSEVIII